MTNGFLKRKKINKKVCKIMYKFSHSFLCILPNTQKKQSERTKSLTLF